MSALDNLFAEGMMSDLEKDTLMGREIWPIVVEFINLANKMNISVKVSTKDPLNAFKGQLDGASPVYFVNDHMLPVGVVVKQNDVYQVHTMADVLHSFTASEIKSSKPKYITRQMRKDGSQVNGSIKAAIRAVDRSTNLYVHRITRTIADYLNGNSALRCPSISMADVTATALLRLVKGAAQLHELPNNVIADIDNKFNDYIKKSEQFSSALSEMGEFFSVDKRIILRGNNDAIVTGTISKQPLLALADSVAKGGSIPDDNAFTYVQIIEPLKYYRSFDDIPEDIKTQIEMQLTMLKIVRGSEDLLPKNINTEVWSDARAAHYGTWSGMRILMLDV